MHHPDALKQNYLLSRKDPLSSPGARWSRSGDNTAFSVLYGLRWTGCDGRAAMALRAVDVHASLVGFRDEVNRASPFKTAQMTWEDAGGHRTEFSA